MNYHYYFSFLLLIIIKKSSSSAHLVHATFNQNVFFNPRALRQLLAACVWSIYDFISTLGIFLSSSKQRSQLQSTVCLFSTKATNEVNNKHFHSQHLFVQFKSQFTRIHYSKRTQKDAGAYIRHILSLRTNSQFSFSQFSFLFML